MRQCVKCGESLPDSEEYFYRRKNGKLDGTCKACSKKRAAEHYYGDHKRGLAVRAEYRAKNRNQLRCYKRDKATKAESDKRYRQQNGSRLRKAGRIRYRKNPAPYIARAKASAIRNPEVERERQRLKTLSRRESKLDNESAAYAKLLRLDPCSYCAELSPKMQIDHIHPISAGGLNHWENFTSACPKCNKAKSKKDALLFLITR